MPHESEVMSFDVIDKSMVLAEQKILEGYYVAFSIFGGEALLEFEKVKYIAEGIKELDRKYPKLLHGTVFTNGILINDEVCNFFLEHRSYLIVHFSLDGSKASHDQTRVYADGSGSFDDVLSGIKLYSERFERPLSDIVFKFMISPENCDKLIDTAEFALREGFSRVAYTPVKDNIWDDKSVQKYKDEVLKLKDFFIKNIDKGVFYDIFSIPILKTQESRNTNYCSIGTTMIGIAPNGDIYPCQRLYNNRSGYLLGSVFSENFFTEKKNINIFKNAKIIHYVDCAKCETFKGKKCLGMCPASVYESNHNLFSVIPNVCEILKFTYLISLEIQEELKDNKNYQRMFLPNYYGGTK